MPRSNRTPPLWLSLLAVGATVLATVATMPFQRKYPAWRFDRDPGVITLGSIDCKVWVAKSGKTGMGLGIKFTSTGVQEQTIELVGAKLHIPGHPVEASRLPPKLSLAPGQVQRVYVPFAFDNESLWNRGTRDAVLEIHLIANGYQEINRGLPIEHHLGSFHQRDFDDRPAGRCPPGQSNDNEAGK